MQKSIPVPRAEATDAGDQSALPVLLPHCWTRSQGLSTDQHSQESERAKGYGGFALGCRVVTVFYLHLSDSSPSNLREDGEVASVEI